LLRSFHPGVGDPVAEHEAAQPDEPMRRLGGGHRDVPLAGQLNLDLQRRLPDDDEFGAQVGRDPGDRLGQRAGGDRGQEAVVERPGTRLAGPSTRLACSPGEPFGHPEQVGEGVATGGAGLFQPGPAGQAVLAGDDGLGVVQGDELARGQAAFRLEFQVTQARPVGQCSRYLGAHGSPSLTPGVRLRRAGKTRR
jgi:hypothetical protein